MRFFLCSFLVILLLGMCNIGTQKDSRNLPGISLAEDVRNETLRTWKAYVKYAWPHDNLLPLSKGYRDWYEQSISISPIDAYSTLKIMGFEEEARRVEKYVTDTLNFDLDLDVKVFEVNIRIMGGLLCMYEWSGNKQILDKAIDFGNRLLPAFNSPTDITTKEKDDQMATFFIAETMKYCWLTFDNNSPVNPSNYVFTTEAHPFKIDNLDKNLAKSRLQID